MFGRPKRTSFIPVVSTRTGTGKRNALVNRNVTCTERYRGLSIQFLRLTLANLPGEQVPFTRYISNLAQVYRCYGKHGGINYRVFRVLCRRSLLAFDVWHGRGWMCRKREASKHETNK